MNIKELLKKLAEAPATLTAEEKAFLREKEAELNDEQKEQLDAAEAAPEENGEEGDIDDDAVKALLTKTAEEVMGKKADEFSAKLVEKFMAGVKEQRAKGIAVKQDKGQDVTRTFFKALFAGDREGLKALSTSTSDTPKAGYTIPTELMAEVLRLANDYYGVARRDMRYLPFGGPGNSRNIPKISSGVTVTWTNEKTAKTSTEPGFGLVAQTLKKLAAIVPLTEELLEDTAIDLKGLISDLIAEALAKEEDTQFFAGTGSPWTGILNNGSVNVVTMGSGETFADITADYLLDMQTKTPMASRRNGKYYISPSVMDYIRKLKASTSGNYIYQEPQGSKPATIWNKPVEELDILPGATDTAAATPFVIFGDLKKCAIFGDKGQIRVKLLEEATITDTDGETSINLAEQDEVALRFVERVGYVLALPSGITVLKTAASS